MGGGIAKQACKQEQPYQPSGRMDRGRDATSTLGKEEQRQRIGILAETNKQPTTEREEK